jgi:hypothetical protein
MDEVERLSCRERMTHTENKRELESRAKLHKERNNDFEVFVKKLRTTFPSELILANRLYVH